MKVVYKCDTCGRVFKDPNECEIHETSHGTLVENIRQTIISKGQELCDYCEHSYYVYGCERDCTYRTCKSGLTHREFRPVHPLHNKRLNGGI